MSNNKKSPSVFRGVSKIQQREEKKRVRIWMQKSKARQAKGKLPLPLSDLIGIPPARAEVYYMEIKGLE